MHTRCRASPITSSFGSAARGHPAEPAEFARLDQAGLRADLSLAARFEDLAQTVADALDAAGPRGPAALVPDSATWIGSGATRGSAGSPRLHRATSGQQPSGQAVRRPAGGSPARKLAA